MLAPIALIRATVDAMIERGFGRIVNITSSAVKAPIDILALSNGARSGLTGFVAGLARRTVAHNVTINNLLPGQFDTDRLRANFAHSAGKDGDAGEVAERRRQQIPAGRFGMPDEFGAACAFLCSAQAGYLTGQNLLIDGGAPVRSKRLSQCRPTSMPAMSAARSRVPPAAMTPLPPCSARCSRG